MNDRVESLLLDMLGDYASSDPPTPVQQHFPVTTKSHVGKVTSPSYSTSATIGLTSPVAYSSLAHQNVQLIETLKNLQDASAKAYEQLSMLKSQVANHEDERKQFLAKISHLTHTRNRTQVRLDEKDNLLSRVSGAVRKAKSEFANLHRQLDLETRRRMICETQLEVARNRLRVFEATNELVNQVPAISTDSVQKPMSYSMLHSEPSHQPDPSVGTELRDGLIDAISELRYLTALAQGNNNLPSTNRQLAAGGHSC